MKKSNTKPKRVSYTHIPARMWAKMKKCLPKVRNGGRGRPACSQRAVMTGIWYVLWTGCQWKAIEKDWFGASSSVIHARFQAWQRQGVFVQVMCAMLRYYRRVCHIRWNWQSADSRRISAPWVGKGQVQTPPIGPSRAGRSMFWWISGVLPWPWMCLEPITMKNGILPP